MRDPTREVRRSLHRRYSASRAKLPVFDDSILQKICQILADGLTGSEITPLLAGANAQPGSRSERRLEQAFGECQRKHGVGNHVVQFMLAAMEPVRYVGQAHAFEDQRARMNAVLAFAGYTMGSDGKLRHAEGVTNLSDAEERAGKLRAELSRRRVHADILKACRAELLQDNYFHAVLEATKSVAEKIRVKTGLTTDGHRLVDDALGQGALPHA